MFLVADIIYFKEQRSLANPTPVVPNNHGITVTLGDFYLNYTYKKKKI